MNRLDQEFDPSKYEWSIGEKSINCSCGNQMTVAQVALPTGNGNETRREWCLMCKHHNGTLYWLVYPLPMKKPHGWENVTLEELMKQLSLAGKKIYELSVKDPDAN
jgi:hypothetical protein